MAIKSFKKRGDTMEKYQIIRMYEDSGRSRRVIDSGLTLEEAQSHCRDPETSSSTCTSSQKRAYTRKVGRWFDGYESY